MPKINIIGLGGGELNQIPLGVYQLLKRAIEKKETVYLRTVEHPIVDVLKQQGLLFEAYDTFYEDYNNFETVYQKIYEDLLLLSKQYGEIIYAVPGHPMVAESVVKKLLEQNEVIIHIVGGHSFLDDLLTAVQVDVIDGFQLVDGMGFNVDELVLSQSVIIMQVFNEYIASDVKLNLLERYPAEHKVALVHEAGTTDEKVEWIMLYELDRMREGVYNLTSVYVPPLKRDEATKSFQTLQSYIDDIAKGDMWLQEQTHETLLQHLKDEVEELEQAIKNDDIDNLIEELGDVLCLVLYQISVAEHSEMFNLEEVLEVLNRKLRRRCTHVFDNVKVNSIEEIDALWQKIKEQEKVNEIR